jgi:hypothetical protein
MPDAPDIDASPPHQPVMVAAAPLHLLKLPREIRNRIYDFLSHEIDLRTINEIGGVATIVHITNAPCVEVLMTHSRLHEEYLESKCFRNLSAVIFQAESLKKQMKWPSTAQLKDKDIAALARVKNITFRFIYYLPTVKGPINIVDALLAKGTTLHTVRLIEESRVEDGHTEQKPGKEPTYTNLLPASKVSCNTQIPLEIHGLPLRQYCHGGRRAIINYPNGRNRYYLYNFQAGVFSKSVSSANFCNEDVTKPDKMRPWAWEQVKGSFTTPAGSTASTALAGSTAPTGSTAPAAPMSRSKGWHAWISDTELKEWKSRI